MEVTKMNMHLLRHVFAILLFAVYGSCFYLPGIRSDRSTVIPTGPVPSTGVPTRPPPGIGTRTVHPGTPPTPATPPTFPTPGVATATSTPHVNDLTIIEYLLAGIFVVVTAILCTMVGVCALKLRRKFAPNSPPKYKHLKPVNNVSRQVKY